MKVLVIDDDVVSRMVLMHLIDSCGSFEILEAEDGEDAWQQLARGLRPAICFCDLRMPRLSGMELLQRVKGHAEINTMPFVLVSSAADRATVDQAAVLGADGYIVKPFQAEQVREHLAAFADLAAAAGRHLAEAPLATMQRLGINGDRLLAYLGGFQSQLAAAGAEIDGLLAGGAHDVVRARIERLRTGCTTLGLYGAADSLRACAEGTPDSEAVQLALADAVRAVMHQGEAVKRMRAAS